MTHRNSLLGSASHTGPNAPPPGWKSPFRQADGLTPIRLYQIVVERTRDGEKLPIGPAMARDALGPLYDAIRAAIKSGQEKDWSNPTLVAVT